MTYQVVYPYKWTCIRVTVKLLRMCCRRHCRRAQACYLCTSCCPALSRSPSLPHIPCVRRLRRGTLYGVPLLFDGILVQPIAKKLRLGFRAEQTCPNRASRWLRGRRRLCGAQLAPARAVRGAAPPARLLASGARRWRRGHAARTSREWALCRSRRVAGGASTRFGRRGGAPCRRFAALEVAPVSQWSRQPLWPVWAGWGRGAGQPRCNVRL